MNAQIVTQYRPNYASPPGDTLLEILEDRGISQAELAQRMKRPKKTINEIIQGKAAITPDTALQLERVLGTPASFWNRREQQFRETLARLDEQKRLRKWVDWLGEFPIKAMMEQGLIPACSDETELVREVLTFFGVASPEAWRALWKQSLENAHSLPVLQRSFGAIAVWLRQGEREAQHIDCAAYNPKLFHQILVEVRSVPRNSPDLFASEVVSRCARAGVAVTFVSQFSKTPICGAARWLSPHKALIQLSAQLQTDDQLFFHEAGHILLHKKRDIFLEPDKEISAVYQQEELRAREQEADEFAAQLLARS